MMQIIINSLVCGTQVLLLASGLYLIYAVSRVYHIALAGVMTGGAYTYFVLKNIVGEFVALPLAVVIAGLLGLLSFLIMKKLIKKRLGLLALLSSLGIWMLMKSLLAVLFSSEARFLSDTVLPVMRIGELNVTEVGLWTLVIGCLVALLAYLIMTFLPAGRMLGAIAQHRECASLIGINEGRVQLMVFVVAAAVVGLIGIFTAMNGTLTPTMGTDLVIVAFSALLVGGVHDFRGTVVASYLLTLIPEILVSYNFGVMSFSSSWKMVFMFCLALFLLFIRPNGLFGISLRNA